MIAAQKQPLTTKTTPLEKESNTATTIKMERRESSTSESSLEHLDLGRTPKKLNNLNSAATSTPHLTNGSCSPTSKIQQSTDIKEERHASNHSHDSDEANDYDDEESADEQQKQQIRMQRHHKRRVGRLDKRPSVQLELNAENPNSLRKKFRFNRSCSDSATTHTNNESGFIDASGSSSQLLNASASSTTVPQPQISPAIIAAGAAAGNSSSAMHTSSSASSSPRSGNGGSGGGGGVSVGGGQSVSSPESGIGERDDMKYVCPICEVVSATPHEFTNHIRCHNYSSSDTENFRCQICSKVLSSASSLDRHVLVHTGERPFNCKYCHLTFTTNGNMHRHMRTHKQHQHNHHRRKSNGTKNNNNNNSSNNNNNNSNNNNNNNNNNATHFGTPATMFLNAQLTNGINSEGVKSAAASATTLFTTTDEVTGTTTTTTSASSIAGANGKRFNGNNSGVLESYESDGGCSTDSSSANSQSSNNHKNQNNNNNNNDNHSTTKNNNHCSNNNNNNNINKHSSLTLNNFKRKHVSTDDHLVDVDVDDEIALMKRRVKTTINNNNIIDAIDDNPRRNVVSTEPLSAMMDLPAAMRLACPVCGAMDFEHLLSLGTHMDTEHGDIPAKCRDCEVVFRTHRQLNVHPCTRRQSKSGIIAGFCDFPLIDFSGEKFPLIAKSLCEQSLRTALTSQQRFECQKCGRNFPAASGLETHVQECAGGTLFSAAPANRQKQRTFSESSHGPDDAEPEDDDQHQRDEFFRNLFLKNKQLQAQSLASQSSPPHSSEDAIDGIKFEPDESKLHQNLMAHQSTDSKDLADIQSILNMTSSSSTSNFLRNFEQSVNTPSSNYSLDKDEEEAQDAFTSEFRKMKLRGEFPCKLCTAVFPNLRALKGHNRIHLSAAGPAGPFRCNMCPYSICDKAALVRHMRTHNGDRPYECAVCNYAFTTKANCERHLRNRHAKTTRDDVKRAIIYHPSEDSSCDDPAKKLHMFSSPDFDDDCDLTYPKDRSTPVSHLKEMLIGDSPSSKPAKIQVKSLEQLLDKAPAPTPYNEPYNGTANQVPRTAEAAPMDLSMDVLDLSKKPTNITLEKQTEPPRTATPPPATPKFDNPLLKDLIFQLSSLEKGLMAQEQQRQLNEQMPNIPPYLAEYFYRQLLFPARNPFFMPNEVGDIQKIAPLLCRWAYGVAPDTPLPAMDVSNTNAVSTTTSAPPPPPPPLLPQISPLMSDKPTTPMVNISSPSHPALNQMLSKSLPSPTPSNASLTMSAHIPSTVLPGGPVKMVIKNGVLMPKQKQRRYRTERPFACEHCSARFTLRSNMERHVKQQHPQYYAQRQRSGHHIMRGRGASSAAAMNSITHLQASFGHNNSGISLGNAPISEQVKYAILAQQLKARKDSDLLQQALSHGSNSVTANQMLLGNTGTNLPPLPSGAQFGLTHLNNTNANGSIEDDEPKLIIDEDDDDEDDDDDNVEEIIDDNEIEEEQQLKHHSDEQKQEALKPLVSEQLKPKTVETHETAKKTADTILEQAIKSGPPSLLKPEAPTPPANSMKSMIAQAESVGKFLKEVASSPFKDDSQDLVPVSKLVDNATNNSVSFNNYFRPSDIANHMEQSDEEGLVASGSASESNNSGTEDVVTSAEPKKKSAYSLAPNRVSCPYCQRMFPWSSSLRRHILTHTGQKPFKCSHCPLLFTTKSNCDRHLLRKHGNVESAVSVYVPTEDVNEPIPLPKSVEEIEEEERRRKAEEARKERERRERELRELQLQQQQQQQEQEQLLKQLANAQLNQHIAPAASPKIEANAISSSELPFKCHLCESSFGERFQCLEHIKIQHTQEFALLLSKGAIDTEADSNQAPSTEDDERRPTADEANSGRSSGGKYPDYSNRKVICAFCIRRFWSTEDLRRHMRTHSGERPFQCEVCLRKFTLKHSMLRHMKKHNGRHHNSSTTGDSSTVGNSGSDYSDDEQSTPTPPPHNLTSNAMALSLRAPKIQDLLSKANEWRSNHLSTLGEQKENIASSTDEHNNNPSDLIGNLLGISDQGILNKLLSSADEAAKLLGVDK